MVTFEFSRNVIKRVIEELDEAEKFIRIAIFQLHNQEIFQVLQNKLSQGVKVEILTLPYDSIHDDIQLEVKQRFLDLESSGAKLYFCKWNVGDPERTSTASGRWYSFHGKFVVTDKSAIALSANFTNHPEWDAMLTFKGEPEKISEFDRKFQELLELFVITTIGASGKIKSIILSTSYRRSASLFELPKSIKTEIHKDHWVISYPIELCPPHVDIQDRLYILPFDVRGRNIIQDMINEANSYIYVSTESFTDPGISNNLIAAKLRGLSVKILTGATSMDFNDRLQQMLRGLLASGININTLNEPLHAKFMITDKYIAVSSINMNKMNLGFFKSAQLWRENTETITITQDPHTIEHAKNQFEIIFDQANNVTIKLAEKLEKHVGSVFNQYYNLRSSKDVKKLFSIYILFEEINAKKVGLRIGRIVKGLVSENAIVQKEDFIKALVLDMLSDNRLKYNQIEKKLSILQTNIDLDLILLSLISHGYIELQDDNYKLRVLSLF